MLSSLTRPIALAVGLTVALPLLSLGHWHDPLANTVVTRIFPHSALALFLVMLAVGIWLFTWMHSHGQKNRGVYLLASITLGLSPAIFYSIVCAVSQQPAPPLSVAVIGVITGTVAGLLLGRELPSLKKG